MDNRKESWTKADGTLIHYDYRADNLLEAIDYDYPSGNDVSFEYDADGRTTKMTDGTGEWIYTYDYDVSRGYTYKDALLAVTQPTPAGDKTLRYEYDEVGNRTKMLSPSGVTHSYSYDGNERLTQLSHPTYGTHIFQYDWLGNRTGLNYANGAYAEYTYNARNWLWKLYNRKSDNSVVTSFIYGFDHVGNRARVDENDGAANTYTAYGYDNVYQLTNQTRRTSGGSIIWQYDYLYDEVGNRTHRTGTGGTVNYTYDANNKMLTEGSNSYGYDNNGNTTSKYVPGTGTTSYSYDYENRMTGITYPNATTAAFQYNGDGLRVRVTEPGVADYFIYDGVRPYARYENYNSLKAIYVAEGGSYYSPIVTLRTNNANWTYLRDGTESVRKILNDSQTTTDAYYYEAFGNITSQAGTTVNPFRYIGALGYYRDQTSGLLDVGARYYSPQVGRFWTRDPAKQGVNWYPYVGNNPVNAGDPSGLTILPGFPWELGPVAIRGLLACCLREVEKRAYEYRNAGLDKLAHCYGVCAVRGCGTAAASLVAWRAMNRDEDDPLDKEANKRGFLCALRFWQSCEACCADAVRGLPNQP
jgi:RHS repeat-associated protein